MARSKPMAAAPVRVVRLLLLLLLLAPPAAKAQIGNYERLIVPQLAGHAIPANPSLTGYLFKPAGTGPFPTIILLHGCDGLGWATPHRTSWRLQKSYAERYVAKGYAALVLDSFAPRRLANICGETQRVSGAQRAWDAFAAVDLLVERGIADPRRLVLQGESHGGFATLTALAAGRWSVRWPFTAGIAFYPGCDNATHFARGFTAPLLILIGDADDWTPAAHCKALADRFAETSGPPITLEIFPGATHAFDFPLPERINRLGHRMQYDEAATKTSWELIERFLGGRIR